MRGLIVVVRRECVENRRVLLAAALAAFGPILVWIAQGRSGQSAEDARTLGALVGVAGFWAVLVVMLGSSTLAREMANRRISFDFSRPLSAAAIWAGKLGAILVLLVLCSGILVLPALVLNGPAAFRRAPIPELLLIIAACALLLPAVQALSILLRSRSALIGADLLVFGLAALTLALAARPLVHAHATIALRWGLVGFAVIAWLGFLAASFRAVTRGRADIRAAHRAVSPVLWLFTAIGVIGFVAYTRFVLSAGPEDLTDRRDETMPKGNWMVVGGHAQHRFDYQPCFAYDLETRVFHRLTEVSTGTRLSFSHDGKTLLWLEGAEPPFELVALTLDRQTPSSSVRHTRIFSSSRWSQITLSADDQWLALAEPKGKEPGLLSVYDLPSGRFLGSTPLSPLTHTRLFFTRSDLLRVYEIADVPSSNPVRIRIFDFDWTARKATAGGEMRPLGKGLLLMRASPDGDRLLVRDPVERTFFLADARSGQRLAALSSPGWKTRSATFLSDGRIALAETNETQARFRIVDGRGQETSGIDLPYAETIFPGGEISPGKLVVAVRAKAGVSAWTSLLIDPKTGSVKTLGEGLFPLATSSYWNTPDPFAGPSPGSPASRLFSTPDQRLVEVDPATGERRVILGNPSGN